MHHTRNHMTNLEVVAEVEVRRPEEGMSVLYSPEGSSLGVLNIHTHPVLLVTCNCKYTYVYTDVH